MVVGAGGMLVGGQGVAQVGQGRLLFRAWQFMQLMCDVMSFIFALRCDVMC